MNIHEKMASLQVKLKAPKNQYNSFGKYKYRNCEDILEGVKPLLLDHKLSMTIKDDVLFLEGRFYIKATVTVTNSEAPEEVLTVTALAREEDNKKGMDGSQVTGASSSYARKYALNGMFAIDDTKDADSMNNDGNKVQNNVPAKTSPKTPPKKEEKPFDRNQTIIGLGKWFEGKIDLFNDTMNKYKVNGLGDMTDAQLINLGEAIKGGKIK